MPARRLEVLHVRLTRPGSAELVEEIRRSAAAQPGLLSLRCYRHASFPTDLAVHLQLDQAASDPQVTELGVRLAAALREYGMVEHTAWLEVPDEP